MKHFVTNSLTHPVTHSLTYEGNTPDFYVCPSLCLLIFKNFATMNRLSLFIFIFTHKNVQFELVKKKFITIVHQNLLSLQFHFFLVKILLFNRILGHNSQNLVSAQWPAFLSICLVYFAHFRGSSCLEYSQICDKEIADFLELNKTK